MPAPAITRSSALRLTSTALLAAFGVQPVFAEGQSVTTHFDIPAQSLNQALLAFGRQSGWQLLYSTELVENLRSRPLKGEHSPEEGLKILLGDAPLEAVSTGSRAITLKPAKKALPPSGAAASDPRTSLPKVKVTGKADYGAHDPYSKAYAVINSSTANKTDTPIIETPMSIQVVPRAVMDDQQAISLKDSLQNVSGVQWSPVEGSLYESFVLRGFDGNASLARNGVRETNVATETANLQQVEVLKGPAAMLYGRIEPGGLVNRVTKQPLFIPYYSLQQQAGSFDNYRTTADATGPINGELAYRFNLAYQNTGSFRDFVNNERIFLAPTLTWRPSNQTELGLSFEYQHDNGRWDDGIPAAGNRPANTPISRYLGDPISNDKQDRELIDFHWSHQFNEDWQVNQRFVASLTHYDQFNVFPWSLLPDNTMNLGLWNAHTNRDVYSQNINLVGHFDSWGAKHTLLTGFDFYIFDQTGTIANPTTGPLADSTALQNLYNPIYGRFDPEPLRALPVNSWYSNAQEWYGVYLQDQIKLWDKLQFLLGGRYDWATMGSNSSPISAADAQTQTNRTAIQANKFSPRFGILYQPWQWMSIYGNYTESLGANNGRDITNTPLKPQEGRQFEIGAKNEFFDGRLTSTVAFFDIVKTNIQANSGLSPAQALAGFSSTIGEARSRGIEWDLAGQLTDNWSLIANYAWTDTRITRDGGQVLYDSAWNQVGFSPEGFVGNRLPLAPTHSANLWIKYEFTDEIFRGLSLGTGARIASQRQGNPANDFQLPGYVTWNAMVAYKHKVGGSTLTAQLNAYNILDHRYYAGTDQFDGAQRFNIIPAAPVNFMGSLRLEY
jgi:iron complex outermembrane recepter protein